MSTTEQMANDPQIEAMFKVGVHYGYARTRRHPSTAPFVFGMKNNVEIINLEKTKEQLAAAVAFVHKFAAEGKTLLLVGTKKEAQLVVKEAAVGLGLPYVSHRWIGGTLTNWNEIKKRLLRLEDLSVKREKGELTVYTKRERGVIDREIEDLERLFGGIATQRSVPHALFIIDPKEEETAVREAVRLRLPVVAIASTDCDLAGIDYPVVGNDGSRGSITFFVQAIAEAYAAGRAAGIPVAAVMEETPVEEEDDAIVKSLVLEEAVA